MNQQRVGVGGFFMALLLPVLTACSDSNVEERQLTATRCIADVSSAARAVLHCDGVDFTLTVSPRCLSSACGLIVDVHGFLSDADQQEQRSQLGRIALDRGGYIVVQPSEPSEPSSWDPAIHNAVIADFMRQMITAYAIDEDRVHVTGFSQGGLMTFQFACDYSDMIASVAPLSAIEIDCFRQGDGPEYEVPMLYITGTNDILIPYYNEITALSVPWTLLGVMYDYAITNVDAGDYDFADNGALRMDAQGRVDVAGSGVAFEVVDGAATAGFLWTRYTNASGTRFEHLRHDNGHVYPDNPDSEFFPEQPAVWFSIGEAIFEFFQENPRRRR